MSIFGAVLGGVAGTILGGSIGFFGTGRLIQQWKKSDFSETEAPVAYARDLTAIGMTTLIGIILGGITGVSIGAQF